MSSFSSPAGRRDAEHRRAFSVTAAHLLTEEFVALSSEAELQRTGFTLRDRDSSSEHLRIHSLVELEFKRNYITPGGNQLRRVARDKAVLGPNKIELPINAQGDLSGRCSPGVRPESDNNNKPPAAAVVRPPRRATSSGVGPPPLAMQRSAAASTMKKSTSMPAMAEEGPAARGIPPIKPEELRTYRLFFSSLAAAIQSDTIGRAQAEPVLANTQLPRDEVDYIWSICDGDGDGAISADSSPRAVNRCSRDG